MMAHGSTAQPSREDPRPPTAAAEASLAAQFGRYVVVGGAAFVVDFGSLFLLTRFAGLHYLASATVAFLLGLAVNYVLSRAWVFRQRAVESVTVEFTLFALIGVVGLGLNDAIMWTAVEKFHVQYLVAKAISAAIVLVWNFGARKALLFTSTSPAAALLPLLRRSAAPLGAAAFYLLFCVAVQAVAGAWHAAFNMHPDEPSQFVGAVMVRDWLLSGRWAHPMLFAKTYYDHYPYFAIGYWPPFFHVVTALWMLAAGVGRVQALLVPAASAAGSAWLIFHLVRGRAGAVAGAAAGLAFLSIPAVQTSFCAVMVDHLTAFLCLAAAALVLRYVKRPTVACGAALALTTACAVLSKYSAAYLVALPFAAIVLSRRWALLRRPSLLMQPVIIAVIVGPWAIWTRELATYGLPSQRPALTAGRAAEFVMQAFRVMPQELIAVVLIGLAAALLLGTLFDEDVRLVAVLAVMHLGFFILSPVDAEARYMIVPAAAMIVVAFAGWAALIRRLAPAAGRRRVAAVAAAVLGVAFAAAHFGRYVPKSTFSIPAVVARVLQNNTWTGGPILLPADLEGPVTAEFVAQEHARPACYLVRPGKLLVHQDWFHGNYSALYRSPDELMAFVDTQPIRLILWHQRSPEQQYPHEQHLGEVMRRNPSWRKAAVIADPDGKPSWTLYERAPLSAAK